MTRHIGQYAQCHTYHGGVAGTHTIHTVVEISTIAHCRNHDDCHHNEENPTGSLLVFAAERHHLGIVEVVVLQEGYRGLKRFLGFTLVLHHHLLALALHCHILAHHSVRTEKEHQPDNQSDGHLTHYLVFTFQSLLVASEYLYIVVEKTEEAEPYRSHYHENKIDITHTPQQQHRHEYRNHNDNASHSGHTLLLHAKGVDACVALHLGDVATLHVLDKLLAKPCRDNQRQDERQKRPE